LPVQHDGVDSEDPLEDFYSSWWLLSRLYLAKEELYSILLDQKSFFAVAAAVAAGRGDWQKADSVAAAVVVAL
jgi:hypothetical protein